MAQTKSTVEHQEELDALEEKDPEFYKFLKEEDSSLLKFDGEAVPLDDWSSDEDDDEEVNAAGSDLDIDSSGEEEEEEDTEAIDIKEKEKRKKKKQALNLTEAMVLKLKGQLMEKQPSLTSIRRIIAAFHSAVANIDGSKKTEKLDKKKRRNAARKKHILLDSEYTVTEASVFNAVVGVCIQCLPSALGNYLKYYPDKMKKTKKNKVPLPSLQTGWKALKLNVQTYLKDSIRFLELLMDASVKRVFLRHMMVMSHYFIVFRRLTKAVLKVVISLWSSDDNESIRVLSFFFIMRIVKLDQTRYLEKTLQRCYLSYVSNCKFTSPRLLPMINFMQQTYTELCAIDSVVTYNFAFVYIRQLAIHLRAAVTKRTKEHLQTIYNWQYVHSIGLWSRCLSVLYPNHTLQPLLYPLIQVALGCIGLNPSKRYYPLQFRLLENLIQLGDATNTYIPLISHIIFPLQTNDLLRKPPAGVKQRVYMDTMLKFSKTEMEQQSTRDAILDQVYDLLMSFFNSQAHTISFPEMIVPAVVVLRRFAKNTKNVAYSKIIKNISDWIIEDGKYIKDKRAKATFEVTDVDAVIAWESEVRNEGVPFYHHYNEYRLKRERELITAIAEKDRVVEERMPTVDHEKFRKKFKQADKEKFGELFDDNPQDVEETFSKILEQGGFRRTKPRKRDFVNDDIDDDVSDQTDEEKEARVKKAPPAKKKKRPKVKVGAVGKKDIVQELRLSDIE